MEYFKWENGSFIAAPQQFIETKEIDGNEYTFFIITENEAEYNKRGYYKKVFTPMPQDEYNYIEAWDGGTTEKPYYEQIWVESGLKKVQEEKEDPLVTFMKTLSNTNTNSIAKMRAAAEQFLRETEQTIGDNDGIPLSEILE